MSIAENLAAVRAEIAEACAKAGRNPAEVKLMAVSKTHGPRALAEAFQAGQTLFGENKVQEWEHKRDQLQSSIGEDVAKVEMHLIGNLQSNKASKAAWLFAGVDAVDTIKVAAKLNAVAAQAGQVLPILIEVKTSEEESKHGVVEYALPGLMRQIVDEMDGLEIRGLMTVPPFTDDPGGARPYFAKLRELRDNLRTEFGLPLPELSIGMSHDFAIAIEEGSTCVRIGTGIFGQRGRVGMD
ncbi:MAG: YggS family pyridoxal phosphate-dependent enzyme [Acidobacteria bacterium]|nr:YggS family pyridoxal phosphate-dependent enzyme [Acidobacteriota bacterium]